LLAHDLYDSEHNGECESGGNYDGPQNDDGPENDDDPENDNGDDDGNVLMVVMMIMRVLMLLPTCSCSVATAPHVHLRRSTRKHGVPSINGNEMRMMMKKKMMKELII